MPHKSYTRIESGLSQLRMIIHSTYLCGRTSCPFMTFPVTLSTQSVSSVSSGFLTRTKKVSCFPKSHLLGSASNVISGRHMVTISSLANACPVSFTKHMTCKLSLGLLLISFKYSDAGMVTVWRVARNIF